MSFLVEKNLHDCFWDKAVAVLKARMCTLFLTFVTGAPRVIVMGGGGSRYGEDFLS